MDMNAFTISHIVLSVGNVAYEENETVFANWKGAALT